MTTGPGHASVARRRPRSLTRFAGLLIIVSCVLWSSIAVILSVQGLITVYLELRSYVPSLIIVGLGAIVILGKREPRSTVVGVRRICTWLVLALSISLMVTVWLKSNSIFHYWKAQQVTSAFLQMLPNDVDSLVRDVRSRNAGHEISANMLPPHFGKIGRTEEFAYGYAAVEGEDAEVLIAYGYKSRRWGIFYGDESSLADRFQGSRRVPLSARLFYFTTTDY